MRRHYEGLGSPMSQAQLQASDPTGQQSADPDQGELRLRFTGQSSCPLARGSARLPAQLQTGFAVKGCRVNRGVFRSIQFPGQPEFGFPVRSALFHGQAEPGFPVRSPDFPVKRNPILRLIGFPVNRDPVSRSGQPGFPVNGFLINRDPVSRSGQPGFPVVGEPGDRAGNRETGVGPGQDPVTRAAPCSQQLGTWILRNKNCSATLGGYMNIEYLDLSG